VRKLVALTFLTLDGVMASPETWAFPYFDGELAATVGALLSRTDSTVTGRVTYQDGGSYRPTYVVSTTLRADDVTVLRDVGELAALRHRPGRDIGVLGGATLIRSLLALDLLDELHLLVHPVLVGRGPRLFGGDTAAKPLKLRMVQTFGTGVVHSCYEPATG
jgi:dihydrofolate reductase